MFAYYRTILRVNNYPSTIQFNGLHISSVKLLNQNWRMKKGLPENPNSFSPLTNLPDYSFKDSRPVPYGKGQMKRIEKQRSYAARIIKLVGEVDGAVEKYAMKQKAEELARQKILESKLKPKGNCLLKHEELTP